MGCTPRWYGELDEFVMREAADLCRLRELSTGIVWHVDHMIPLRSKSACGLHCSANIQVIPAWLNWKKGNKLWLHEPDAWLAELRAPYIHEPMSGARNTSGYPISQDTLK